MIFVLAYFNLPAGLWEDGERGIATYPNRVEEFRDGLSRAMEYAKAFEEAIINCIVGIRDSNYSYAHG